MEAKINLIMRLNPQKELQPEGVTSVAFKPSMISHLMQEPDYRLFLKGGVYTIWIVASRSINNIQH